VLRDERYLFQLIPPIVGDHDGLLGFGLAFSRVTFLHSFLDDVLCVVELDCVEDVEKI
jgi:hypothetical protein